MIPVKGTDTRLIPGQDSFGTAPRDNGQKPYPKGTIMNNNGKVSKSTVAGVVGLTAAGIAATIVLANDTSADTTEAVEAQRPVHAYSYNHTGLGTADAVEGWLQRRTAYLGPKTPDAAEAWIESGTEYTGPRTPDAAERWMAALRDD